MLAHHSRARFVAFAFALGAATGVAGVSSALAEPPADAAEGGADKPRGARRSAPRKGKRNRAKESNKPAKDTREAPVAAEPAEDDPEAAEENRVARSDAAAAAGQGGSLRRSSKMEFDARLIRGETAGSGAVVLFDRGQRELPPLTEERSRFLDATLEELYDRQDTRKAP